VGVYVCVSVCVYMWLFVYVCVLPLLEFRTRFSDTFQWHLDTCHFKSLDGVCADHRQITTTSGGDHYDIWW